MPRKSAIPAAVHEVDAAFDAACEALAPLAAGARILLGCSAGGDSMALLHLVAARAVARHWKMAVVHVDHRQRDESADEALWVALQARELNVEMFVERLDDALTAASPLSEDVMRQARYELFRRRAAEWSTDALVLAHQADDRAETFLIRLLAGSGPTGLAAIRPIERVGGLVIARPLLAVRREDLRAWLNHHGLEWREDPSNSSLDTKRGWVRHALLPAVRAHIGLDPTGRIVRASELIDEEAQAIDEAAALMLGLMRLESPAPAIDRLDLTHPLWSGAGPLLRRQLLRRWLWDLRRGGHPPGFEAVAEALNFVEQARPGAELRTIERIHIAHLKTQLLAFGPETPDEARAATSKPLLPAPARSRKKKSGSRLPER